MTTPVATPPAAQRVNVGNWTLKNPDGSTENFSFDILKRRYGERDEASRVFRRLLNVRRSLHYEQDIEQILA